MIIPTKHENLVDTSLVVGSSILKKLKRKPYVAEDLYRSVRASHDISIGSFFDSVTFLWCNDLVEIKDYEISMKKVE